MLSVLYDISSIYRLAKESQNKLSENFQYFEEEIDYIHINFNSKNGIGHREVTSTTACYVQMDCFQLVDLRVMEKVR